jgi:hypothetical protein
MNAEEGASRMESSRARRTGPVLIMIGPECF